MSGNLFLANPLAGLELALGVAVIGSVFSSVFGSRLLDSAFAATGHANEAAESVPVAFAIAGAHPPLLTTAQDSFLDALTISCIVIAGLCHAAALAGLATLPGRFHTHTSGASDALRADPADAFYAATTLHRHAHDMFEPKDPQAGRRR